MPDNKEVVLEVEHLTKAFKLPTGEMLTACNDITFQLFKGETLGIVGESGSGKSTLVRSLVGLHQINNGKIILQGKEIAGFKGERGRKNRQNIQMVFQNAGQAFDPKYKIVDVLCEPLRNFDMLRMPAVDKAKELLTMVELPESFVVRYPGSLSGGQKQRVDIARALASNPAVLICDEATSALDMSVQEKVVKLLVKLQKEKQVSILFICHDLALVSQLCHRVLVMRFGNIVEILNGRNLERCLHPYTTSLLQSILPVTVQRKTIRSFQSIVMPSLPKGYTHDIVKADISRMKEPFAPKLMEVLPEHWVSCYPAQ